MVPGLHKYSCQFSLDPNTSGRGMRLSENNRKVSRPWPDIERFIMHHGLYRRRRRSLLLFGEHDHLVLSSTGLRGRCYWEVMWKCEEQPRPMQRFDVMGVYRSAVVEIRVGYKGSGAQRRFSGFEEYNEFWSLRISSGGYSAHHNDTETPVYSPCRFPSGRVGVFLDTEGSSLSFYQVCSDGELSHLHTFTSTFTEPLFPGFKLAPGCSASLCEGSRLSLHRMML